MLEKIVFQVIPRVRNRYYHNIPFLDFYEKTTGKRIDVESLPNVKKKHPNFDKLTYEHLNSSLAILNKFNISALEACQDIHILTMNPITMDNYGEVLKECGFLKLTPRYIIKYHTIVRSRTITQLKKENVLADDVDLEDKLLKLFPCWPSSHEPSSKCIEASSSILNVRMKILQLYLNWKLNVTEEEFQKYCRIYLPLKHKPMTDIQEAISLAEHDISMSKECIRRNGFIMAVDPVKTKLMLENVPSLAGLDIREVIRIEPAILRNNYNALLQIRDIFEEFQIPQETQRKCLKVYCLTPNTIRERFEELEKIKQFQILRTNPRMLYMVVHKRKALSRLNKIQANNKNCYSLNHLVSSSKVFNNYVNNFGDKACGRDIAILICSSLNIATKSQNRKSQNEPAKTDSMGAQQDSYYLKKQLKRHKYFLHIALNVVDENLKLLKSRFNNEDIMSNCQLLMYPVSDIQLYLDTMLEMREKNTNETLDSVYNSLNCTVISDTQILSLILYELEKKHHFTGDGIWNKSDQNISGQLAN